MDLRFFPYFLSLYGSTPVALSTIHPYGEHFKRSQLTFELPINRSPAKKVTTISAPRNNGGIHHRRCFQEERAPGTIGNGKFLFSNWCFTSIIVEQKGRLLVSTQPLKKDDELDFTPPSPAGHESAISTDGLDHIFRWASDMVAEGDDERVKVAREKRVRRQVLDVVQKYKEQRVVTASQDEVSYLQRRVIALLTKMQELTEENAAVKQVMVGQYFAVQRIPHLEEQIRVLKAVEFEKEAAVRERRYLMDALAKLKVERDYLEDLLNTVEDENTRLSGILRETRQELTTVKSRKWWQPITDFLGFK